VLDVFGVPERLEHVRRYIWREGSLRFALFGNLAAYELSACWDAAALEVIDADLQRWTLRTTGYVLRIGIDLAHPASIAIQSSHLRSQVPFAQRPIEQVEHALQADLAAYVEAFLATCPPVPAARAEAAERLRQLKLIV